MKTINAFEYDVDIFRMVPIPLEMYRGEVNEIRFRLLRQGIPFAPPDGVSVRLMIRNRTMTDWYGVAGSADEHGITVRITPEMDDGSNFYRWFVELTPETSYRINGSLRIHDSPGVLPAVIPPPADYVRRSDLAGLLQVEESDTAEQMIAKLNEFMRRLAVGVSPGEPVPPGTMDEIYLPRRAFAGITFSPGMSLVELLQRLNAAFGAEQQP